MDEPEAFGAWLGRQLRRKGMSQAELAKSLEVTRAAVSAWITGRAEPRPDKLQMIEEILGLATGATSTRSGTPDSVGGVIWSHRPAPSDGGRELGNAAAFAFDSDLAVVAREATQNSLDERYDPAEPVRIRFLLHELTGERVRRFLAALRWNELEPHLEAAADRRQKVGRVLADGIRELRDTERLVLLRIDDYNAAGLTGPEYDDGRFAAVVRRQLDSHKHDPAAGGSFGLGKATLWAASRFGLVLMHSTLSEEFEGRSARRLVGRLDLPWREIDGKQFAGPAWLGEPDPERRDAVRSWWADEKTVDDLYLRRESGDPGTSFLIVGAHDAVPERNELHDIHYALVRSLADNFWASMVRGNDVPARLIASVETLRDGEVVIPEKRVDPHEYQPERSRAVRAYYDRTTVPAMAGENSVVQRSITLAVPPKKNVAGSKQLQHEAVLLVTPSNENDRRNRLVTMRGTMMVVYDRKVSRLPLGSRTFQAVLLAGLATGSDDEAAIAAEEFLRAAEPPEHNDWKVTDDLRAIYARGVVTGISGFLKRARDEIRSAVKPAPLMTSSADSPLGDPVAPKAPQRRKSVATGFPTVKSARGSIRDGAWHLRVDVRLPERDDPWILEPVLRFLVRSGSSIIGKWAEIRPEAGCIRTEAGHLRFKPGIRSATFTAVSDVASHPVDAQMTTVEVDLARVKEASR
ncbi:helix-turn-helix transcriptional regulator [Actinocorallia libanotica]|uniref:HTH cro/C1-type domain-containing protein n=1 Tax=Actinocorallia libanotica TaxID=46162 RepID=A0ABN1R8V4_9ACTN